MPPIVAGHEASRRNTPVAMQSGYYDDADLPPSAGIRGQYVNAGSRDAGPDRSDDNPYIRYRREQQRKADEAAAAAQRQ